VVKKVVTQPELSALAEKVTDMEGQKRYAEAYRKICTGDKTWQNWDSKIMEKELKAKTKIFVTLAKGIEDKLGVAEGRETVRDIRQRQGTEMGKEMAERVKARGGKLNLSNFFEEFWGYFAWSPHCDEEKTFDDEDNLIKYVLRQPCHLGDYLNENAPSTEFSGNYCDLDEVICKTFNPSIRYSRKHWAPQGDLYCELIWELDSKDIL